jgi:DNA-binding response OmpR family regulator
MTTEPASGGLAAHRVLLAEDDRDIRDLVSLKLTGAGFEVIAVGDGVATLKVAREQPIDLVLLDVTMPLMSGLEVVRELRLDPATVGLPIILLTARSQEFDVEVGLSLGATDYVVKPFSPRELVQRVHSALSAAVE